MCNVCNQYHESKSIFAYQQESVLFFTSSNKDRISKLLCGILCLVHNRKGDEWSAYGFLTNFSLDFIFWCEWSIIIKHNVR